MHVCKRRMHGYDSSVCTFLFSHKHTLTDTACLQTVFSTGKLIVVEWLEPLNDLLSACSDGEKVTMNYNEHHVKHISALLPKQILVKHYWNAQTPPPV